MDNSAKDSTTVTLKDRIKSEMITAMRNQEKKRVAAIRLLTAEIKQREVDSRIDLDDTAVIALIDKMISQRKDALQQYQQANRADLAEQEEFEIRILQEFLPEQLSEQEVNDLINAAISSLSATSMRDMGKVIAELKPKLQGRADMPTVSQIVKDRLS
jgi:uncharacterized protein YqeY